MLTRKQLDLLDFIHKRVQRDGVPPSFDEMREALDLRSKSGIHRLITALEERGFIRRLAHRARAVEIVEYRKQLADDRGLGPIGDHLLVAQGPLAVVGEVGLDPLQIREQFGGLAGLLG